VVRSLLTRRGAGGTLPPILLCGERSFVEGGAMKRTTAVVLAALISMMGMMGLAGAEDIPPHGHVRLLHAVYTGSGPTTNLESYQRCVDLANGQHLALHAHHEHLHFGRAGEAQRQAGHLVVPTKPFGPIENCAELATFLPPSK
jgi:hypothetical protein